MNAHEKMVALEEAIHDLNHLFGSLNDTLGELDAMGIHLDCDRSPLSNTVDGLISLRDYYRAEAQAEASAIIARQIAKGDRK